MQRYIQRIAAPTAIAAKQDRQLSDLVYQGTTLAAMLWLLMSLWVF